MPHLHCAPCNHACVEECPAEAKDLIRHNLSPAGPGSAEGKLLHARARRAMAGGAVAAVGGADAPAWRADAAAADGRRSEAQGSPFMAVLTGGV